MTTLIVKQTHPSFKATYQSGLALATSLIFLVIISIISASLFRNIVLQEKMAGNLRAQTSNFEAANSSIARNWNLLAWVGTDSSKDATTTKRSNIPDQFDIVDASSNKIVDLNIDVDICFAGEALASGFSWSNDQGRSKTLMAQRYLVKARSTDTVNSSVNIDRSGYIVLPAAGQPSNCP
ncbi:MAG: pilus assembly PilX N-terminal domain-containing protein [Gammaproteobacteria bacterium]|nr:pilus assembly PilX N-terminal domain-containing protein [Gammaproteobacteria bacterium]